MDWHSVDEELPPLNTKVLVFSNKLHAFEFAKLLRTNDYYWVTLDEQEGSGINTYSDWMPLYQPEYK